MTATPLPYVTLDLSAGGMARLQLALELGPLEERYVVLKWLDQESTRADPHASRRFLDEARLALELHHPNIVTVHQVLESGGRHCIVMAWIRGMSLRQVLQRLHPAGLPPRIAARVVHDLCLALHHAWHSRNERTGLPLQVVHRDLKPENVMLTLLGQTKVIDFGVAQATTLLTPSALHATPQYASPEQAGEILAAYGRASSDPADAGPLDGRSDLFCAGLILQELLTGRTVLPPPRDASTEAALELLSLIHTAPVVPEAAPGALAPILRRALAFQRRHRYSTGEEFADALAHAGLATEAEVAVFLEGLFPEARQKVRALEEELHARRQALPPVVETPVVPPPTPLLLTPDMAWKPPPRRTRWGVVAGVAGGLLLAGAGGAAWYQARMRPQAERSSWQALPAHPLPEDATFTLAIEVRNARGQPVSGQPVRFEATGESGARVELPDVLTDEQGHAERPLSWQRPERVSVVPVLLGRQPLRLPATSVTFEALAPDAAQSSLVASSPVKAGERLELSATLRDVHGHAVVGRPVRFALDGAEARTGEASTDANGRATFPFETREAGDFTARASLETGGTWTALEPLAVRVVAGAPSLAQVFLGVEPARAVADDTATVKVVARVGDAYGNPVVGQPVLLVAEGEGVTPGQPGVTSAQGVAEGTLRSTRAGAQRVCMRVGGLTEERCQEVLFVAGPPVLSGLRLVPRAREVAADGRTPAEFTLRVADAHDNPIADASVKLSAKGVGSLVEKRLTTGPDGTALVHVRSKMTGASTVTAQLEGTAFVQRERVQFVAGSPDRHGSSMSVAPEAALADGKSSVEVTVQVLDAEENPVRGRFVLLHLTGVGPEQLRRAGPTDDAGEASASFTSIIAGQGSVSAELEGARPGEAALGIAEARPVRFLAGLPGKPTLSVEPPRGRVGTPLQLTVEVWDQSHRNPLAGTEVRWDVRGSSEAFTLAPSKSDEQGRATVSLTPTKSGNVTLVAKVVGDKGQELTSSLNVGIDSGPPAEARLGVESGAPSLRADGTDRARLVLRLLDAQGNAVKGQAVRWEGTGEGDTLEPESESTDETGRIRATFLTRTPGKHALKAVATGTSVEASLTLTGEKLETIAAPAASPADAGSEAEPPPGQ